MKAQVSTSLTAPTVGKIDEAHGYKNLRTPSNITDAAIDGSMRASDLDMKIGYLRRRNGDRVVTFATATPIANSVTEAYVMQRYLRPDLLQAAGIEVFDTWAATFGQVVSQIELAPEGGSSFRMKSRFARFANVPEMLRMLHIAADVKTADDLALPVPDLACREDGQRAPETVIVEPSDELLDYVHDLGERAGKVRSRAVGPDEDNMLKISGDGRRAALDLRLPGLPQATPGKIDAAARRIAAIWDGCRDREYLAPDGRPYPVRGSLQLVFCDLGTPGPDWNVYDELRHQLTARGLPREAIRFIHEAKTDRDKGRLFAACRTGSIAVLIGSTEKMGVGTNVQDRAIALHHLDAPWRPADVAQREGRILRQGNLNPEVSIIRYVTERSFDGYMWQTLERKARFITQVMHGRLDTREIADIGDTALSFSEVKALATGNPLLMDKAEADAALARLQRAERAHRRNQDALRRALDHFEEEIVRLAQLVTTIDSAIKRRRDTHGDQFTMTVGGWRYDKRADAGQHLKQLTERELATLTGSLERSVSAGELGGFPVTVALDRSLGRTQVTFSLDGAPGATIEFAAHDIRGTDPIRLVTRLENRLSRLEERKATALADTDHARREITHARDGIGQLFPHAAELAAAHDRARQIDEALERMARPDTENSAADPAEALGGREENTPGTAEGGPKAAEAQAQAQAAPQEVARPAGPAADTAPAAWPPAGLDHRQAGAPPRRAATGDPDQGQASSASAVPHHTSDTVPSQPDAAAARQRPGRSHAADSPSPADSQHVLASRAALSANEAYRAGNLDQARQLIDQAEALDPSRADLWQQHRAEITARQLFLAARTAHAEGDHHRAERLIGDARQLDPRMRALWNQDLPATQAGPHPPGSREREPGPGNGPTRAADNAVRDPAQARWPNTVPMIAPEPSPPGDPPATARTPPAPGPGQHPAGPGPRGTRPGGDAQAGQWQPRPIRDDPASAPARLRGTQPSGPAAQLAETADWRDAMIEKGRQEWQPKVVQPDGTLPHPPQARDPEINS